MIDVGPESSSPALVEHDAKNFFLSRDHQPGRFLSTARDTVPYLTLSCPRKFCTQVKRTVKIIYANLVLRAFYKA